MVDRYIRGSAITLRREVRDFESVLYDPTSIVVTLTEPDGVVQVDAKPMLKVAVGEYKYQYSTLPASVLGLWSVQYKITSTEYGEEIYDDQFELIAGVPVSLPVYCTPDDVASILQVPRFSDTTMPTRDDVIRRIIAKEDYIDSRTSQSWRSRTVADEQHEYKMGGIKLFWRPVRAITSMQLYQGNDWKVLAEGRDKDFIVDCQFGIIYFVSWFWHPTRYVRYGAPRLYGRFHNAIKVAYMWGKDFETDPDRGVIGEIAAKLVAIDLFTASDYSDWVRQGANMVSLDNKIEVWSRQTDDELRRLTRIRSR
jgi:hypothetical protein